MCTAGSAGRMVAMVGVCRRHSVSDKGMQMWPGLSQCQSLSRPKALNPLIDSWLSQTQRVHQIVDMSLDKWLDWHLRRAFDRSCRQRYRAADQRHGSVAARRTFGGGTAQLAGIAVLLLPTTDFPAVSRQASIGAQILGRGRTAGLPRCLPCLRP